MLSNCRLESLTVEFSTTLPWALGVQLGSRVGQMQVVCVLKSKPNTVLSENVCMEKTISYSYYLH